MMTDFGDFFPARDSARKRSGNAHPPTVPIAARVPILRTSRRETPSQKSRVEGRRPAIVNMLKLRRAVVFHENVSSSWRLLLYQQICMDDILISAKISDFG
jgi:hypothetical protein